MHRVFVVEQDPRIISLFQERPEFRATSSLKEANIVVFPGGPDISPDLYKQTKHPTTSSNPERDYRFTKIFNLIKTPNVLKIGICGGGQFLNVMNGGWMYQDVDNHIGTHPLTYSPYKNGILTSLTGQEFEVTSTHHQMMCPSESAELWGFCKRSTYRDYGVDRKRPADDKPDTEILFYPASLSLCFQPHPEYGHKPTETVFFKCVYRIIARSRLTSPRKSAWATRKDT